MQKKSLHLQALKFKFNAAIARKKSGDGASWKRCHVDHAVTNGDVGGVVASNPNNLILQYRSQEIENKLRIENTQKLGEWQYLAGIGYEYVKYNNRTVNKIFTAQGPEEIDYMADLAFHKYSAFGSLSRKFFNEKLSTSFGFRLDGNSYSDDMSNPLDQFSPRFSLSYQWTEKLAYKFNVGRYFQLPPYTSLGYTENNTLVNKQNNISFIAANHLVTGLEYTLSSNSQITVEAYYKTYQRYDLHG